TGECHQLGQSLIGFVELALKRRDHNNSLGSHKAGDRRDILLLDLWRKPCGKQVFQMVDNQCQLRLRSCPSQLSVPREFSEFDSPGDKRLSIVLMKKMIHLLAADPVQDVFCSRSNQFWLFAEFRSQVSPWIPSGSRLKLGQPIFAE